MNPPHRARVSTSLVFPSFHSSFMLPFISSPPLLSRPPPPSLPNRHPPSTSFPFFSFHLHLALVRSLPLRSPLTSLFCLFLTQSQWSRERCRRRRYSWWSLPSVLSVFCCTTGATWAGEWLKHTHTYENMRSVTSYTLYTGPYGADK